MNDLRSKLEDVKKNGLKNGKQPNKILVIIEGLYSMEGEFCKLKEVIALKKVYGFYLYERVTEKKLVVYKGKYCKNNSKESPEIELGK